MAISEGERMLLKKFNDNGIDFNEYKNLIKQEVWMVASLIGIEDRTQELLKGAKLMARDIKVASKKILSIIETRDSKNFKMVQESAKGEYESDVKIFAAILKHLETNLYSEADRVAFIAKMEEHVPLKTMTIGGGNCRVGNITVPKSYLKITKAQAIEQFLLGRIFLIEDRKTKATVYVDVAKHPSRSRFADMLIGLKDNHKFTSFNYYVQNID